MVTHQWPFSLLCFVLLALVAVAFPQNQTIDDADSSLEYSEDWLTTCLVPLKQPCPELSQVYNGTFHWAVSGKGNPHVPYVVLQFIGTAVYIYNVLVNDPYIGHGTAIDFVLDGDMVGS